MSFQNNSVSNIGSSGKAEKQDQVLEMTATSMSNTARELKNKKDVKEKPLNDDGTVLNNTPEQFSQDKAILQNSTPNQKKVNDFVDNVSDSLHLSISQDNQISENNNNDNGISDAPVKKLSNKPSLPSLSDLSGQLVNSLHDEQAALEKCKSRFENDNTLNKIFCKPKNIAKLEKITETTNEGKMNSNISNHVLSAYKLINKPEISEQDIFTHFDNHFQDINLSGAQRTHLVSLINGTKAQKIEAIDYAIAKHMEYIGSSYDMYINKNF